MNYLDRLKDSLLLNKDRHAFCINEKFYTYGQLYKKICNIVNEIEINKNLRAKNIGVITNNDVETYASLIACWFLGYAYIPVSPATPKERNNIIIREAAIDLMLSSSGRNDDIVDNHHGNLVWLNSSIAGEKESETALKNFDESVNAYILFTSGSTGVPKGVPITHGNLSAFVENFLSTGFEITSSDRCLQMFELTFDVSISSFLIALFKGACVYTLPEGIKYVEVLKLIQQHQLTNIQIVPSIIRLGKSLIKRLKFPWLRNCILTGEASSVDLIPELESCAPNATIYNFYGPTEATIYCSFYNYTISKNKNYNGMLAIGRPMGNMDLVIVNENNNEAGVNEKGELLIGGKQITNGYLNSTEKSASSLVKLNMRGERIFYRSGDMCYMDHEGDIYYCGRFDNQVKIQGFRVELSEIEYLVQDKFKYNNIVIARDNNLSLTELILVLELPGNINTEGLTGFLKSRLPEYMVPTKIETVLEFPLNSSGKTDRKKIKELLTSGKQ
jgi:D-alanine--poly(phosphoribitol) ligase subunit 1